MTKNKKTPRKGRKQNQHKTTSVNTKNVPKKTTQQKESEETDKNSFFQPKKSNDDIKTNPVVTPRRKFLNDAYNSGSSSSASPGSKMIIEDEVVVTDVIQHPPTTYQRARMLEVEADKPEPKSASTKRVRFQSTTTVIIPNSTTTPKESRIIAEVQTVIDDKDTCGRFKRYTIAAILKGSTRLQLKLAKEEEVAHKEKAVEHDLLIQARKEKAAEQHLLIKLWKHKWRNW